MLHAETEDFIPVYDVTRIIFDDMSGSRLRRKKVCFFNIAFSMHYLSKVITLLQTLKKL